MLKIVIIIAIIILFLIFIPFIRDMMVNKNGRIKRNPILLSLQRKKKRKKETMISIWISTKNIIQQR